MAEIYTKKKDLLIPERLMPRDVIGIAAPASPFDVSKFYKGIKEIESMGFKTNIYDDLFETKGYLAGSDRHRADLLNRLFEDKEIDAIICARGGFGSLKILPLINYEIIEKNPKIFIGFSDVTALLTSIYFKCGLITFHGPMVATLAQNSQVSKESLFSTLRSDGEFKIVADNGVVINKGRTSAPVCGGNLATLCHTIGTFFEPDFSGHILFLEEYGEAPYRIDRMLTQMKLSGCFDGIAGLALGTFKSCGDFKNIIKIINNIFSDFDIPVLSGFDIGHGYNNLTVPVGVRAELDTDKRMLLFHKASNNFLNTCILQNETC